MITVDGRPVAALSPLNRNRRWMPRHQLAELVAFAADPALRDELAELAPDSTDDEQPW